MTRVSLGDIVIDFDKQVRVAVNADAVRDYAMSMKMGSSLPPVTLFGENGGPYYLGDGVHRVRACQQNGYPDIAAEIRRGTQLDALWYALGANKTHGLRLTDDDKKHAVLLALRTWPDQSSCQIATQIGCSDQYVLNLRKQVPTSWNLPDRVTGKDGKSYPAAHQPKEAPTDKPKKHGPDKSRTATAQRYDEIRRLANEGHNLDQIAAAVGITRGTCQTIVYRLNIEVPASRVQNRVHRHDATRIVEHIVMDAENLTADVTLIDFARLEKARIADWVKSLGNSRRALDAFIRQLKQGAE